MQLHIKKSLFIEVICISFVFFTSVSCTSDTYTLRICKISLKILSTVFIIILFISVINEYMYKQSQTLTKIIDCTACDELNNKLEW